MWDKKTSQYASSHQHSGTSASKTDPADLLSGHIAGNNYLQSANYVEGVDGWKLFGDGTFEGNEGHFRGDITGASGFFTGEISVGTSPNWFRVNSNGDMWLGRDNLAEAKVNTFAVTKEGVLYAKSAVIGNWNVNATSIYTGTEDHSGYTANEGDITIYSNGSDASIHAKNFYIDTTGVFYTIGATIDGTSTIGGRVGSTLASAIDSSGHFIDANFNTSTLNILASFTFGVSGALQIGTYVNGVTGDLRISPSGILGRNSAGATTFSIDGTTGAAVFSGTVTAVAGAIGGWTINATSITDTAGVVGMSSAVTGGDDIRFWAGHATPASAPFKVTEAGALTATSATISGSITSTSGTIGGFTLAANLLSSGTDADYVGMSSDGTNAFWAGDSTFADAEFSVTSAGVLKATSATITGAITASSGSIGSFTIGTYLYTGTKTAYNDANAGVHLGSDGIGIGNNVFTVSSAGAVVATSATVTGAINATSGKIGTSTDYWSIGATGLTATSAGTDVIINYGKTLWDNTQTGFILGYDYLATKSKFYIGNTTDYFNFNGDNVVFRTTLADAITIDYGSNILLKEGGSIKFTSVTAPTACTATLIETGTGNIDNGDHKYRVTYVNSTGETSLGAVSNTVTVDGTHKQVQLSSIPTSSSGAVTSRKIYRTKAGATTYYLLTTLNNNTATEYTDNTADGSLTGGNATDKENNTFGKLYVDSVRTLSVNNKNVFIGASAGSDSTTGNYNVFVGNNACAANIVGTNNVAIGGYAGALSTGNENIFIGYRAGLHEVGSDTFYLDVFERVNNTDERAGALMYGTFSSTASNQTLTVNGKLTAITYNALTLTAVATGFTIAGGTTSKTLTVPLDASVSGTNTGDQTLSGLGGAPNTATFLTATAETGLSAEVNLGALSTGLLKGTVTGGVSTISAITDSSTNWNTAYGWGNHASAGYLTSVTAHNLLSTTHGDTTASACARGSVIVGDASSKWVNLAFPATPTGKVLIATATDVAWSASALDTGAYAAAYSHPTGDGNLHVPANSTTNNGKVLTASASAGVYTWETPTVYETAGAVASHAALTTGIHGLAITAGQTLTVTTGGTLGSNAYTSTAYQASNATLDAVAGGTYTGDDSIATVGTITAGVWTGTDVAVADGGTGLGAVAAGSILAANSANVLSAVTSTSGTTYLKNTTGTISWDSVLISFGVGDYLLQSADTTRPFTSASYIMMKEIQIRRAGNLRIKFSLKSDDWAFLYTVLGQIRKNGVAVGTERTNSSQGFQEYSEDITGWAVGDLVQIYCKKGTAGGGNVGNFRIYVNELETAIVNTD